MRLPLLCITLAAPFLAGCLERPKEHPAWPACEGAIATFCSGRNRIVSPSGRLTYRSLDSSVSWFRVDGNSVTFRVSATATYAAPPSNPLDALGRFLNGDPNPRSTQVRSWHRITLSNTGSQWVVRGAEHSTRR